MADEIEDVKAQEIWGLRLLDVERLDLMYRLMLQARDFGHSELFRVVEGWISDYLLMMAGRDSDVAVRHEVMSKPVEADHKIEEEHIRRTMLVNGVALEVYGDEIRELAGVVRESCYKSDFKDWLETRLQGWYIDRFGYDDLDVEFLTEVREAIYGVDP